VLDAASDEFDRGAEETEWASGEKPAAVKDHAIACTREHYNVVQVHTEPVLVQHKITLELENSLPVIGYVDVVERENGNEIVTDNKTSKRKYQQQRAELDRQLLIYQLALEQEGRTISGRRYQVAVKTKAPSVQTVEALHRPSGAQVERLLNCIGMANAIIQQGLFPPCTAGWWCCPDWCGYWGLCKYHV